MRAVTLTERVETFGRTFERGAVLFVAAEFECVANLVDADGVPRISHLPVERFVDGVGGRESGDKSQSELPQGTQKAQSDDSNKQERSLVGACVHSGTILRSVPSQELDGCQDRSRGTDSEVSRVGMSLRNAPVCEPFLKNSGSRHNTPDYQLDAINADLTTIARSSVHAGVTASVDECPFEPTGISTIQRTIELTTPNVAVDVTYTDGGRLIVEPGRIRPLVKFIPPPLFYEPARLQDYNARWHSSFEPSCLCVSQSPPPGDDDETTVGDEHPRPAEIPASDVSTGQPTAESQPVCSGTQPTDAVCAGSLVRVSENADIDRVVRIDRVPMVPRIHSTQSQTAPGQYPEPGDWMSADERRGWRRVVTDGRTVWKFGPDVSDFSPAAIAAELDRWNAWLARVRAFFVDTISQSA